MFITNNLLRSILAIQLYLFFSFFAQSFNFTHNYEFGYELKAKEIETNNDELRQNILSNPALVLQDIKSIQQNEQFSFEDCINAHPLSFLDECTKDICKLNRLSNDSRKKAAEMIVNDITLNFNKHQYNNKKPLKIISFASGDLFQDLIILLKLHEKGYKHIEIKLIDTKWDNLLNVSLLNKNLSLDTLDQFTQNEEHKKILAQMLQFRAMLPNSWSINFYSNEKHLHSEFWQRCTHHVLWGIDFIEQSYLENTPDDFRHLIKFALFPDALTFEVGCSKTDTYIYATKKNVSKVLTVL